MEFGEVFGTGAHTILLYGTGEYGTIFDQVTIEIHVSGDTLYFDLVRIEEGDEYPYPHIWHDYDMLLYKIELIG